MKSFFLFFYLSVITLFAADIGELNNNYEQFLQNKKTECVNTSFCTYLNILEKLKKNRTNNLVNNEICNIEADPFEKIISKIYLFNSKSCLSPFDRDYLLKLLKQSKKLCYGNCNCKKIGLYIGTFDPFHYTHYEEVTKALKLFSFDELYIIINKETEGKIGIAQFDLRKQMAESYFNNEELRIIKVVEDDYNPTSKITKIKHYLNRFYSDSVKVFNIMGRDVFDDFIKSSDSKLILRWSDIIVNGREGVESNFSEVLRYLPAEEFYFSDNTIYSRTGRATFFVDFNLINRGSFGLKVKIKNARAKCKEQNLKVESKECVSLISENLKGDLSEKVLEIILQNNLYPDSLIQSILEANKK